MAKSSEIRKKVLVSAKRMAETSATKTSKAYKIPTGLKPFYFKKGGVYRVNIVPFKAGFANPAADEGEYVPGRSYFCHPRIGPSEDTYLCTAKTYGKPCRVCEVRAKKAQEGDEDATESFRPRHRQLWNFHLLDGKNKDEVALFDFPAFNFGDNLFKKVELYPKYDCFADPGEGFAINIEATEEKSKMGSYYDCQIQFTPREDGEEVTDEILETAACLDDILTPCCPTSLKGKSPSEYSDKDWKACYNELKEVFEGGKDTDDDEETEEEEDDEKPVSKKKPKVEDDEEESEEEEETPKKKTGSKKPKDEEETEEEEEEPKKPSKKPKTAKDLGIKIGSMVNHEEHGLCEVTKISGDGTSLTLEDEDTELHKAVDPNDCQLADNTEYDEEESEEEEEPKKKTSSKKPKDEEEEEEEDEPLEEEEEEEEEEKPRGKKSRKR